MGVQKSKLSKIERSYREDVKKTLIENRVRDIDDYQRKVFDSVRNNEIKEDVAIKMLSTTSVIKQQVERGDQTLTKTDLIAIIIALDHSFSDQLTHLEKSTVGDLNIMIRSIIYSPQRAQSLVTTRTTGNHFKFLQ